MTIEEILALDPRAADIAAAELVLGWQRLANVRAGTHTFADAWLILAPRGALLIPVDSPGDAVFAAADVPAQTPHFDTDKTHAYVLVDAMARRGHRVVIEQTSVAPERWGAAFPPRGSLDPVQLVDRATAQSALTRAALLAVQPPPPAPVRG